MLYWWFIKWEFSGNLGESTLGGVIGVDSGDYRSSSDGRSYGKVSGNIEVSSLGESLGSESGTEVGSDTGLSGGRVMRKVEGSSGVSNKGASGKGWLWQQYPSQRECMLW